MKSNRFILLILSCILSMGMHAQTSHWTCDAYAYEYDMALYFSMTVNGIVRLNMSNYEVAAFCGEECRGVADYITVGDKQIGYLRIYSNVASGETITFKVYDKTKQKEFEVKDTTLSFKADTSVGVPSNPFVLSIVSLTPGDVNSDGKVDTQDAIKVIQHYLGKNPADFNSNAADMNGDNKVDTQDAIQIIRRYLNKQ